MNGEILMVSDALCYGPFASGPQTQTGPEKAPVVATDSDPIRARLADTARQEERRRRLSEILRRRTPTWKPEDHPEIDAAGGAAAWVNKLRAEAEEGFRRRTGKSRNDHTS